ncbi:cytidylyltransferase domain-containing protein [Fluviicola sp.]|uniref:cytidylyltransferase domain-containing protein n=1 Tax=Fluviicola sp. TaxID=1917219 RepID=UPI003D2B2A64
MNRPAITALITIQENRTDLSLRDANFKEFDGRHLYRLMIEKLLAVKAISHIAITTDSDKVKQICGGTSRMSFIDMPNPDMMSDDNSVNVLEELPTSDLITSNSLKKVQGEHFLQTQCVNPLLTIKTIEEVIERYYEYVLNDEYKQFDSVMSLSRVDKRLYDSSDYPTITLRDNPHYVIYEDTVFNVFNRSAFVRNGNKKFGKNPMFFEVPEIENLTVETHAGYELAKLVYNNRESLLKK